VSSNLYTALVVEDCTQTGPLLISFINNELPRLLSVPNPLVGPRNTRTGVPFADSNFEPGQGQLVQLRRIISVLEYDLRDSHIRGVDAYPRAVLFPQEEIPELIRTAKRYTPGYGDSPEEDKTECQALRRLIDRVCEPDILIVDLAMNNEEGESVLPEGFEQFDREKPAALGDPRPNLRNLTGFKLIRAFAHTVPVIATSHLSNPLIAQHCLVNGAFAFVHKPVPSVQANEVDFTRAWERSMQRMDLLAKENANILDVMVTHYLTNAAAEVVKAMAYKWISGLHH
jgi:CheY-like chemotaxis protein